MKNPSYSFAETIRNLLVFLALTVTIFPTDIQAQTVNYLGVSINSEVFRGAVISEFSFQYTPKPRSRIRAGLGGHFARFDISDNEQYRAIGPFTKLGLGYRVLKFGPDNDPIQIGIGVDAALGLLRHKHVYQFPGMTYLDHERTYKESRVGSNLQLYISVMMELRQRYFIELSPVFSPSVYMMNGDAEKYPYRTSAGFGLSSNPFNVNLRVGKIVDQKQNKDQAGQTP